MGVLFNSKWSPEHPESLIEHMRGGGSYIVWGVKQTPYIGKSTMYDWEKTHQEWKEAKEIGYALGLDYYEKLFKSVTLGIMPPELKSMGSKSINMQAVLFALKTRFCNEYTENSKIIHANDEDSDNPDGFKVVFVKAKVDDESA